MSATAPRFQLAEATLQDIHAALDAGLVTSVELVKECRRRIEAYDRSGPMLRSVREFNPDALLQAEKSDQVRARAGRREGPLHGIPILLKDNIATADGPATTAGSLALEGAGAGKDACIVRLLSQAGAIILGKANMTEFANFMAVRLPPGHTPFRGPALNPPSRHVRGGCHPRGRAGRLT